ncbi:MAG: precorrin-6y C5,15-methyltransferase (decarboxylating) subunit CbiE, partial [Pseudomonadota bacterium]
MSLPWLTLIGIGEDGVLAPGGRDALNSADIVYGGARHLALAGDLPAEKRAWPSPFADVFGALEDLRSRPVAVLATGDPMWFGIGSTLVQRFDPQELTVLPSLSAFQLAASRMAWPLQDCECLSVHGRPVDLLRSALYPGARLLVLTSGSETPQQVADLLADEGYGRSRMTVLEHLGGAQERRTSGTAEDWS